MNSQQEVCSFSRILVGIDGSPPSIKAAEFALEIAEKVPEQSEHSQGKKNELIALTVLDVSKPRGFLSTFIAAPTYGLRELAQERNEAKQWMENLRLKVGGNNFSFRTEIIEGITSAERAILEYAESHNIGLIVVGSRGRSGFSKVLLGSVAAKVVTHAPCPVLVVK